MSLLSFLAVGILGGIGAIGRFVLDGAVSRRWDSEFPVGTLAVNLLGCLALGVLIGAAIGKQPYSLFGSGLIGAFTTFSTWELESHRLGEDGRLRVGVLNFAVSLFAGLVGAGAAQQLGSAL